MILTMWIFCLIFCTMREVIASGNNYASKEHCTPELFEATCAANEVIVMTVAKFGRMHVGRCVKKDLGYIGCGGNVLHIFDEECSGKQSCSVLVGDEDMKKWSSCETELMQYLEADYKCVKAYTFDKSACTSQYGVHVSSTRELLMSDIALDTDCVHVNRPWKLGASKGQRLNISLIDFEFNEHEPVSNNMYGKLIDVQSRKEVVFGSSIRRSSLMVSSSNEVEVLFYSNANRFALDITVQGCLDMPPPDGAWMTRDGDVMEVGCHSGSKSWTLRCENNHWVGAMGYCGTDSRKSANKKVGAEDTTMSISPNVIVFGVCSLVLLLSSIVFLIGVLILKRKSNQPYYSASTGGTFKPPYHNSTIQNRPSDASWSAIGTQRSIHCSSAHTTQMYENRSGDYKSLRPNDG